MAFARNAGFTSAIATNPADTAAGLLTPDRYNLPLKVSDAVAGAIPWFIDATTEGVSALLAATALVLGGGSGAAPYTSANLTFSGTVLTSSAGFTATASFFTAAGLNQTSGFQFGNGNVAVLNPSTNVMGLYANGYQLALATSVVGTNKDASLGWSASASSTIPTTLDSAFSRISAGLIGVGTGSGGSFAGGLKLTNLTVNRAATFLSTSLALTNGAAASVGTLTNAPAAGDPTKWIGIDDNGTTRYIPAW